MLKDFQSLFIDPSMGTPLRFRGTVTRNGRWKDGVLKGQENNTFPVRNGIPNFTEHTKQTWSVGELRSHPAIGWIQKNWNDHMKNLEEYKDHEYYHFARSIAESRGLGIDIASGPGGGAVPAILYFDPEAKILMSDWGVSILYLWKQHLDDMMPDSNVSFAGMDATNIPLRTGTLDYVVDSGGFGNVEGADRALREVYRVLKPGALLHLNDAITEGLEGFPRGTYDEITTTRRQEKVGWERIVNEAGFSIELTRRWSRRELNYDESDLGALAKKHGVRIYFVGYSLTARKP